MKSTIYIGIELKMYWAFLAGPISVGGIPGKQIYVMFNKRAGGREEVN